MLIRVYFIKLAMFFVYNLLLITLAIILSPLVAVAFAVQPKLRAGFFKKMGFYPEDERLKNKSIWIHAVSVGEINAVEGLVKRIKAEFSKTVVPSQGANALPSVENPIEGTINNITDNKTNFISENILDWTGKFEKTPPYEDVKTCLKKIAENEIKFATLSQDWHIDIKKETSNRKQKRAIGKILNENNFKKLNNAEQRRLNKYINGLEELLGNAKYLNESSNKKIKEKPFVEKYHYFETSVKIDNKIYKLILDTEQHKSESEEKPQTVHLYNINEISSRVDYVNSRRLNSLEDIINITDNRGNFNPSFPIVVTTVTRTGQEVARKKLAGIADVISYFPYDFNFAAKAAIKAFNPALVIIAETEIWPRFVYEANKRNIPLMLVNGRISPGSFKGYRKARLFFSNVLDKFSLILMQSASDAERIVKIGAPETTTQVMGNLKFDITTKLEENAVNALKDSLKVGDNKVLIAGSTHQGEEEIILNAFGRLKEEFPDLKLLLAPRHPERNEAVIKLIKAYEYDFGRRSEKSGFDNADIILLDTMGELGQLYSVSHLAFIGGGFSGTGGHNPLEPAIYGIPVLSGPTVFNFKDIYRFMTTSGAARIADNADELYTQLKEFLLDGSKYNVASSACLEIFEKNKGATDYAIQRIKEYL